MHKVGADRRHCDRCAKQVTDFTQSTDGQILAAFRHNGEKICGRFRSDQLDRKLLDTARPATWWSKAATWLALLFAGSTLTGQETTRPAWDTVKVESHPMPDSRIPSQGRITADLVQLAHSLVTRKIQVDGLVLDENGYPLIGATAMVEGTTMGACTDFEGKFSFQVPANSKLIVDYVGFYSSTLIIDPRKAVITRSENLDEAVLSFKANIVMAEDSNVLAGDIVIVSYRRRTLFQEVKKMLRRWKENRLERAEQRKKATVTQLEPKAVVKSEVLTHCTKDKALIVSPNPSSGPVQLIFHSEQAQQLMLEFIDASGNPVYISPWQVTIGENRFSLPANSATQVSGTYVVRLVGKEKMWTEKVVVQ